MASDVAYSLEQLVPAALYFGSLTPNTEAAYDAITWLDGRAKPNWAAIQAVPEPETKWNNITVGPEGSFQTLAQVFAYLDTLTNQVDGIWLKIGPGHFPIADTIEVNYSFPLRLEGAGANTTFLEAATGLAAKPMFDLHTEADFASFTFDGSTLADWDQSNAASFIDIVEDGLYCEFTDIIMYQAARGINCTAGSEFFFFNFIVEKMRLAGVRFSATAKTGALDIEIGNFVDCAKGVELAAGTGMDVFVSACRFLNEAGQTGIDYVPANFGYSRFILTSNDFNSVGTFLAGVDFTLQRDADIIVLGNTGYSDRNPNCFLNVTGGVSETNLAEQNTWYKANFTTSSFSGVKFSNSDNRITFLPSRSRDVQMTVCVNLLASTKDRTIQMAIVKNGVTASPVAFISLRFTVVALPVLLALTCLAANVAQDDYFELWYRCVGNTNVLTTEEVNLVAQAR